MAANSSEQLVQMLTTYNDEEMALLARVCHFALLRCKNEDPMRQHYFKLINLCTGNIPSLSSLAAMACVKLDNGGLCRNLPSFEQHMEITIYGDQFHLSKLPRDLVTEIFGMDQLLKEHNSFF